MDFTDPTAKLPEPKKTEDQKLDDMVNGLRALGLILLVVGLGIIYLVAKGAGIL